MTTTTTNIRKQLLDATDDPANTSGWVDRIGLIASKIGADRSRINWTETPDSVAHALTRWCYYSGKTDELKAAITDFALNHRTTTAKTKNALLAMQRFCKLAPPWGHVDRHRILEEMRDALYELGMWL